VPCLALYMLCSTGCLCFTRAAARRYVPGFCLVLRASVFSVLSFPIPRLCLFAMHTHPVCCCVRAFLLCPFTVTAQMRMAVLVLTFNHGSTVAPLGGSSCTPASCWALFCVSPRVFGRFTVPDANLPGTARLPATCALAPHATAHPSTAVI